MAVQRRLAAILAAADVAATEATTDPMRNAPGSARTREP